MKRVFAVCLLLSLSAGALQAQLSTFPRWYSPAFGSGVGVFASFGTGLNDDAKFGTDAPMAFGGHILVGTSAFKGWAGANYVDPKNNIDKEVTFGGNLGVTLYKGATSPIYVDIMAGLGYAKFGNFKQLNVPVSIPFAYGAALENGSLIEVWIAPSFLWFSTDPGTGSSESDIGFGGGGGINFYSQMGIGAYVAVDWSSTTFGAATSATQPLRLGAGLAWKFTVPSFPESKGVFGQN